MPESRPILFNQDVTANLDRVVGPNCQYKAVEGSVMDLAHSDSVGDHGFAADGVATDVCGVKQLSMPKAAKSAAIVVCR